MHHTTQPLLRFITLFQPPHPPTAVVCSIAASHVYILIAERAPLLVLEDRDSTETFFFCFARTPPLPSYPDFQLHLITAGRSHLDFTYPLIGTHVPTRDDGWMPHRLRCLLKR